MRSSALCVCLFVCVGIGIYVCVCVCVCVCLFVCVGIAMYVYVPFPVHVICSHHLGAVGQILDHFSDGVRGLSPGPHTIQEGSTMKPVICISSPGPPDSVNLTIYYEDGRMQDIPAVPGQGVHFQPTSKRNISGLYVCRAGNAANTAPVKFEVRIVVEFRVDLTATNTAIVAIVGAPLLVQCMVAQRPLLLTRVFVQHPSGYGRFADLSPLQAGQAAWEPCVATGVNKTQALPSDAGRYSCRIPSKHSGGAPTKYINVTIYGKTSTI